MEAASKAAVEDANAATAPALAALNKQADDVRAIVEKLKVTDQVIYNKLVEVVDDATRRNEEVGVVVSRLKRLGQAGMEIAATIGSGTTTGAAIGALRKALTK